jgi:hypothetical protein
VLDSDRQALEVALHSVGYGPDARVALVRSTLQLEELWVSEALLPEVESNPRLSVSGPLEEIRFEADQRISVLSEHAIHAG